MQPDMSRYPVIIEEEDDGFVVECPSFQGCYTQGDTYEEAMANIRDLIRVHIERSGHGRHVRGLSVSMVEIAA